MTSKEAFEKIVELCNYYHHTIVKDTDVKTVCGYPIDNIRKDLEILEILKKKLVNLYTINLDKDVKGYNYRREESRGLTVKEFNLIKEWLENER